jgi:hypothetical protein
VGKGALRAVPTISSGGGHASLCPPYKDYKELPQNRLVQNKFPKKPEKNGALIAPFLCPAETIGHPAALASADPAL